MATTTAVRGPGTDVATSTAMPMWRVAQAMAPFLFGGVLDRWGSAALALSAALGLLAFIALMLLPTAKPPASR